MYTGDDAIVGRYWDGVLVSQCVFNSSCNGIRLIGPANHLLVQDSLFYGPGLEPHRTSKRTNMLAAVALQPGAWDATEGVLDNVLLSRLTIQNVTTPFHIATKGNNPVGTILIQRVDATGVYRAPLTVESWSSARITNVVFSDVTVRFAGGGTAGDSTIPINAPGVDARKLPVWGLFARNVESLELDHVRFRLEEQDFRPVLRVEAVENLTLDHFDFPGNPQVAAPLQTEGAAKVIRR